MSGLTKIRTFLLYLYVVLNLSGWGLQNSLIDCLLFNVRRPVANIPCMFRVTLFYSIVNNGQKVESKGQKLSIKQNGLKN